MMQAGSTIDISSTKFQDNDFVGPGAVVVVGDASYQAGEGNSGTKDDELTCEFIAVVADINDGADANCINFEASIEPPMETPMDSEPPSHCHGCF